MPQFYGRNTTPSVATSYFHYKFPCYRKADFLERTHREPLHRQIKMQSCMIFKRICVFNGVRTAAKTLEKTAKKLKTVKSLTWKKKSQFHGNILNVCLSQLQTDVHFYCLSHTRVNILQLEYELSNENIPCHVLSFRLGGDTVSFEWFCLRLLSFFFFFSFGQRLVEFGELRLQFVDFSGHNKIVFS
jgi:hypothetical protein